MLQPLMPADLDHATLGRKIAFQNHQASVCLKGLVQRRDHFLPGVSTALAAFRAQREAGYGHRRGMQMITAQQATGDQRRMPPA